MPGPTQPAPAQPPSPQLTIGGACERVRVADTSVHRQAIENLRSGTPLVTLLLRDDAMLRPDLIRSLYEVLKARGHVPRLDVWLHTLGGQTEVPWQIVSMIREYCDRFTVVIPAQARSAGTHVALGADAVLLSPLSTLGPVDPTTLHPLMPRDANGQPIPVSVEDLKHCIRFIAAQLKAQDIDGQPAQRYSPSDMTTIVGHLFDHIDPLAIGAVERAYALSRMITRRVLETHLDPATDSEKIDCIVERIGGGFYSHHFPLTRRDVRDDLQLTVEDMGDQYWDAVEQAHTFYWRSFMHQLQVKTPPQKGVPERQIHFSLCGYVESGTERRVLVRAELLPSKPNAGDEQLVERWVAPRPDAPASDQPFDIVP